MSIEHYAFSGFVVNSDLFKTIFEIISHIIMICLETGLNLSNLLQTWPIALNLSKLIYIDLSKLVWDGRTCLNLSKLDQTFSNWSKLVQSGLHLSKLVWPFRRHSQTTLTRFWTPTPLCWHFLPYKRWQKVDIFGPCTHLFL